VGIIMGGGWIIFVIFGIIMTTQESINNRKKDKAAIEKAQSKGIKVEESDFEDTCEYCGGIYIHGKHDSCPHCGAPIKQRKTMLNGEEIDTDKQ
ncbi:MAG: hypothetical protein K6B41_02425, partial [Butyrivibrio sp.]|nr:hypothetical protein [Butyrivibrio sp.]